MLKISRFILFAVAIFFTIRFFLLRRKKKWQLAYADTFEELLNKLDEATSDFKRLISHERGYFSNYDLKCWTIIADSHLKEIDNISGWKRNVTKGKLQIVETFRQLVASSEKARENYNGNFVQHELNDKDRYFSTILSLPLDDEQRTAIVKDEDHNLVIAGAGCGKTTTITGKVKYIIDRYKIPTNEIALISFTRKSSEEMDERINHKMRLKVPVETFHSLGLQIIGTGTGVMPSVAEERSIKAIISNCFSENKKNDEYLGKLNTFFLSYLKEPPVEEDILDEEGLRSYLKGNDITSLKEITVSRNGNVTYEKQFCRSYEEVLIANFLYLNQIKYEYERDYPVDTRTSEYRQYKPDFYLPDYDIYIEHYGVDENGNVPKWFGNLAGGEFSQGKYSEQNAAYAAKIKWADKVHKDHKTKLVKTYSWENKNKILLSSLEEKLRKLNVHFRPLDPKQVWATIVQSSEKDITDFEILMATFLSLLKSNHYSIEQVRDKIKSIKGQFHRDRADIFLDLFAPVYHGYEAKLIEKKEIDFNDMISKACELIVAGKYKRKLRYLIVDEFQDISIGRYKLLKELLNYNPGCKLFCVGDDWQSIFRFTGSDIFLFTQFEKFFGVTQTSHITSTYRFSDEIIKLTTAFIEKNPNQVKKKLKSQTEQHSQCLQIIYSNARYDRDITTLKIALDRILEDIKLRQEDPAKIRVRVLGRYNHDQQIFDENNRLFKVNKQDSEITYLDAPTLKMEFLTIHGAKGLEADYVIILNCNAGKFGFPSERNDDPILNLLLSDADQFENGEERRLFYVALTRTKRKVFLLANAKNKSKFIQEIHPLIGEYIPPKPAWDDLPF